MQQDRRKFVQRLPVLAGASLLAPGEASSTIDLDPKPLFDISPHLYMQFMEPLGIADSSLEAAWDYDNDDWRKSLIDVTADLRKKYRSVICFRTAAVVCGGSVVSDQPRKP